VSTTAECRARVEFIAKRCLPSGRVWERVFSALTGADGDAEEDEDLVREVYEYWRGTGEVEEATLGWARWLLVRKKRGDEAMKAIWRVRGGGVAEKWAGIVRGLEGERTFPKKAISGEPEAV